MTWRNVSEAVGFVLLCVVCTVSVVRSNPDVAVLSLLALCALCFIMLGKRS